MQQDWRNQLTQVLEKLSQLDEKYVGMGQDMLSYLEGLYYSNGLTYWEYIHLDSLMGLQTPRTTFKDENIFIIYHQMTELMFKLVKIEIEALTEEGPNEFETPANWHKRVGRAVGYFKHLTGSFGILLQGLDSEEFRKFRMALLPSSGFQSVQFRHIEIMSSHVRNLTGALPADATLPSTASLDEAYPFMYWKRGGIDLQSGKKTITLRMFEEKYDEELLAMAHKWEKRNLAACFAAAPDAVRNDQGIVDLLREWDTQVNLAWKFAHLSAAGRHLVKSGATIDATGGTNWRTFLPPRFQQIVFFKELWSAQELDEWGKSFVMPV